MIASTTEQSLFAAGYRTVASIDEAGRGPLAGPVVAACVISTPAVNWQDPRLGMIRDSKMMTARQRARAAVAIAALFPAVGIGLSDQDVIDRRNILRAALLAMKKALAAARLPVDFILVDGPALLPGTSRPQRAVIAGDRQILTVAAASIMAKVERDRIMTEMDRLYPDYGFARHKGYGTKMHLSTLAARGPCALHRRSFAPVRRCLAKSAPAKPVK